MKRRDFLRGAAATGAMVAGGLSLAERAFGQTGKKPNILFILADDLGYGELGCYGQTKIKTPHLDRMAAEGARFSDFYAGSSVCAPSRCALITGLHVGRCRIRGNTLGDTLLPQDPGLGKTLKSAGYATAYIGKWGLGDPGSPGVPSRQGFDYFYGYLTHRHAHNYYPTFLYRSAGEQEPVRAPLRNVNPNELPDGAGEAIEKLDYTPDLLAADALQWLEAHRKTGRDQPFSLFFAPTIPHGNNQARNREMEVPDEGQYANESWPDEEKRKAAMITRLDAQVGDLLDKLRELKLDDNTLVIFTSDNGPHHEGSDPEYLDANGPLRGIKRDVFEGGIRVPMIARWPGHIAPSTPHLPAYFPDVLPTLAQLTGAKLDAPTDGVSFLPTLLGQNGQQNHDFLYWEFYEDGGSRAARMGNWKAVCLPFDGPVQLYDLNTDLSETKDVAAFHPDIAGRMRAIIDASHVPSPSYNAQTAKDLLQAAQDARKARSKAKAAPQPPAVEGNP